MQTLENDIKPWDKLERETSKSFHAFNVYLSLGANRSHALVAKKIGQKSLTNISAWSRKFNWVKRCEAYDLDVMVKSQVENRLRANNIFKLQLRVFELPVALLMKKITENPEELKKMSIDKLYRLIIESAKLIPNIAAAQDTNITQFVEDMKAELPDDEFAKILNNANVQETLDELLESFQIIS